MAWTFYDNNGTLLQGVADNSVTSAKIVDGTIVTADLGNIIEIDSTSTITLDATTDIVLDAGGADILLKDGGTTFGSLNQTGGELRILSGSSPTLAATFAGANVTFAGTVGSGAITSTAGLTGTQVDILAQGDLRLQDSSGNQYVALEANGTTTTHTLTFPAAQGAAGANLQNNGSGALTWVVPSGGGKSSGFIMAIS